MNKKRSSAPVGASSLLTIFAVLCLVVFALLSLSTARAGEGLSRQSARSVADYYAAEAQAQLYLAELRAGEIPPDVTEKDGIYSYHCPISDTLVLAVAVKADGEQYTILRWQSISAAEWEPDDDLDLWDGSER